MKNKRLLSLFLAGMCFLGGSAYNTPSTKHTPVSASASELSDDIDIWDGTVDKSWYYDYYDSYDIHTASQLAGLVELSQTGVTFEDKTVYLLNNLDFRNTNGISSINKFKGNFEGNGWSVYGLKNPFIRYNYGTVKEIDFTANINSLSNSIGIVSCENYGTISDCNVVGEIKCNTAPSSSGTEYGVETKYIGGICGIMSRGAIINCRSEANIERSTDHNETTMYIGGICGDSFYSKIVDCKYTDGTVSVNASPLQNNINNYTNKVVDLNPLNKEIWYECYKIQDNVYSKLYIGGICGFAELTELNSCNNFGDIICTNKVKTGIDKDPDYYTGETVFSYTNEYGNTYYNLQKCYRYNPYKNVEGKKDLVSLIGGICGNSSRSEIIDCSNSGNGSTNIGAFGDICGYADEDTVQETTPTTTTTETTKTSTTTETTTTSTTTKTATTSTTTETTTTSITTKTVTTSTTTETTTTSTTTETTTTSTTTETTTAAKYFVSIDEMCDMAAKDYEKKTGTAPTNAEAAANDDGTISIKLTDEDGNILDTYIIDPETGIGTGSSGDEVNLPQTGNNSLDTAAAAMTALGMMTVGALAIMRSGIIRKKEEE